MALARACRCPYAGSPQRAGSALGRPGHRMDRRQVRHRPAEAFESADRGRRFTQHRQRNRVRSATRHRTGVRQLRGLVSDPDLDVVYIATPHNAHLPHALLALEAGKHTLVEKPLALNADQGQRIADDARSRGLFCMEAYWTAFLPKFDVLRQLLGADIVGEITAVVADFGEWFSASHRIHRPELAGGPMLDLGTYLISLVLDVVGPPDRIVASGTTTEYRRHGPDRHAVEPPRSAGRPAHHHPRQHSDGGDDRRHGGDDRHRRTVLPAGRIHPDRQPTARRGCGTTSHGSPTKGCTTRRPRSPDASRLARPVRRCDRSRPASTFSG